MARFVEGVQEAMVERLAAQAEAGFPNTVFSQAKSGLPAETWQRARTLRLPVELDAALVARAEDEHTTPNDVVCVALREYLGCL